MQWLIDLIIEAIGIPPVFIDRGDPAAVDFTKFDLTLNDNWHDLDLSAIVPANAKGVALTLTLRNLLANKHFRIRKAGSTNFKNAFLVRTQLASFTIEFDGTCPISSDRKISYRASTNNWTDIGLTVKAWWF